MEDNNLNENINEDSNENKQENSNEVTNENSNDSIEENANVNSDENSNDSSTENSQENVVENKSIEPKRRSGSSHVKKDKTKAKIALIVAAVVCVLGIGGYFLYTKLSQPKPIEPVVEVQEETPKEKQSERQLWLENKAINDDYIGEVVFDSGLVNKSFVQAKDVYDKTGNLYHFYTERGALVSDPTGYTGNDVYIWTNWKDMSYDYNTLGGSVFMDYRNELTDQNIIIYGHHFSEGGGNDPERIKAFTPLELLLKEENFKGNETVKLILDNETRTYKIAYIYIFDVTQDEFLDTAQYWRTNYGYDEYTGEIDNDYYANYIEFMKQHRLYDTGTELTTGDNTLTLQTCIGGSTTQFEILVLKQVEVKQFD